ncbi:ABC transporter permease [Paenibacillus athensensis]|uniref:ABC transporter permease n=1 Tax=Paenibacillus athensensis TaxID=1967502 RepID=UPI00106F22A4|nr:ABC transporter permease [Paenibacillus athensensis]
MNLKVFFAYPKGFLFSIFIHPIILALNIALFTSIYTYNGTAEIKGYDLTQMIWYYAVTTFVWIFTFNFADRRMSNYILSGDLGPMLLRPITVFRFELAHAVALRTAGVLFEFVPDMIIYSLIYPPVFLTVLSFGKFLAVIALAFCLHFLLKFLIGMSAVLTQNNTGLNNVLTAAMTLLGGAMIPLDFFPGWLKTVCEALPFKYIFYEPVQFFLNRGEAVSTGHWLTTLGIQLIWCVVLYALGRFVWMSITKKIVIAGG